MELKPVKIAVDAMGGDFAPANIVEGAVQAVRELGLTPILVGREPDLARELVRVGSSPKGNPRGHHSSVSSCRNVFANPRYFQ